MENVWFDLAINNAHFIYKEIRIFLFQRETSVNQLVKI